MDREQVIAKIDDWEWRLNNLHSQIEKWFQELPPNDVKVLYTGAMLQVDEGPMQRFNVPPRMLPTRAVVYGRSRVNFVPSVLWVEGANGRVCVVKNDDFFVLLDFGGEGERSDWQIMPSMIQQARRRPFDQKVFNNLVLHQAIEAA